jgi:secernin
MCDTYLALGNSTLDGSIIFGKNSDRTISEPQLITSKSRMNYPKGKELKCTYISIPQVLETNAVILSQPFWIWGAEMGANEHGVVIGNEAVRSKEPYKDQGLLGMDLLRLGLERGKTAEESLNVIIELLEKYGQGGTHLQSGLNYHNSMIVADCNEGFLIETAGEWWVVEIIDRFRSVSNDLSIRGTGDLRRSGIIQHAIEKGYCKDDKDFDFALTFSSSLPFPSYSNYSHQRLSEKQREITPSIMMSFLREHDEKICRHQRKDLTAGSQVSSIRKEDETSIHWFTGSCLPCLSTFKPYMFPIESQISFEPKPYSDIDDKWFWKKHLEFIKPYIKKPNKENPERESYRKKLREEEQDIIIKVNEIISKKKTLTEFEFNNQISFLNKEAWKKSEKLIT